MAMTAELGLHLQSFTGNGDINKRVKNSKGTKKQQTKLYI